MKKWIFVGLGMLGFYSHSFAQIFISHDVETILNAAVQHSVTLRNNELSIAKDKLEYKSILNKYIPTLTATGIYGYMNNDLNVDLPTYTLPIINTPIFDGSQTFHNRAQALHGGLMAKAVLFSGGQIYNGAKAQGYKNKGNELLMEADKDALIQNIISSLDQLRFLQQALLLIEQTDTRLQKEKLRVEKAIENGLAIPYDREKITLAVLELEAQRADILNKKQLLLMKLAHDSGLPVDTFMNIVHELDPIVIPEELHIADKYELEALEAFKKANEYLIKKEKGSLLPTLGAVAGYSYTSLFDIKSQTQVPMLNRQLDLNINHLNLNNNFLVGVVMSWNIFEGFERSHKIKSAQLTADQIENKLQDTQELLDLQLEKNKVNYKHANEQINIARQRVVVAENNMHTATKQYAAGLIGITERLAAETDLYKQQLTLLDAIMQQRKVAMDTYQSAQSLSTFITVK
jgi:outer membrane protein TolC